MKHLFADWEKVQNRIRQAQTLFLLLDYDGTLTPIVARPELALCPPGVKVLLEKLRDYPKVLLAIISGRSLEDIRAKVGISGITYVGNHGLEIENPAGIHRKRLSQSREQELKRIKQTLEERLGPIPGLLFEDKGPILTVHYRQAPPESFGQVLEKVVEEVVGRWEERWQITSGKKIWEIRPRMDFSKGKTVRALLRSNPGPRLLPIYLGDDRSDEDAFQVVTDQGLSIFVGPSSFPSVAHYFLREPSEVHQFLHRCEEILRT